VPNRIIKESICTSDNIENLKLEEEVFFYRLLVNCDDYGRMDARPQILRAKCFPLRTDKVKPSDISKWLNALARENLIIMYRVDGGEYLQMVTWDRHQQIRAKRSKFPEFDGDKDSLISDDINCNQMIAYVPVIQSNPIQSESESNTKDIVVLKPDHEPPKEKIPFNEIIDHLNTVCGTGFKASTKETRAHIQARWKDGFRLNDFKAVIDKKVAEWLTDPEMSPFLRPQTLFGTKFESYLNQKQPPPRPPSNKPPRGDYGRQAGDDEDSRKKKELIKSLYLS
jgi:uncharacterized phage protein (TIGR02220 family)